MTASPPSTDGDPGPSTARTFTTMGTVASLRAGGVTSALLEAIVAACLRIDRLFSLYLPDSDLSRLARREIGLWKADPAVTDAYAQAIEWRSATHGNFTPHRPDGTIDLSGIVKAIAIADVGDVLDAHSSSWLFSVGGDVLARGDREGEPWQCGLADPAGSDALLGSLVLTPGHRAIATSGTTERGDHVWRTDRTNLFRQVTVAGPDIVTADVLATAILAGGRDQLDRAVAEWPIDVVAVTSDGEILATGRIRSEWAVGCQRAPKFAGSASRPSSRS